MEEEAERRRQPPLKLEPEPEVKREKSHRDREREKRVPVRPVEPAPEVPQKHSDDEEAAAADEPEEEDGEEEEGYPPEAEVSPEVKPSQLKPAMRPITTAPSVSSASGNGTPGTPGSPSNESPCGIIIPGENTPDLQPLEEHRPKIGLSLKLGKWQQQQQPKREQQSTNTILDSQISVFGQIFCSSYDQHLCSISYIWEGVKYI